MDPFDQRINDFTLRQFGLIAMWQARAAHIPAWVIESRVKRRLLLRVHAGVYRHAAFPFTQELRWLAAVLAAGRGAVLSHRAGAVLHHYALRRVRPEVTARHGRLPTVPGVDVHRSRRLRPTDITVVNNIPVTSRARTLLDLGGILPAGSFQPVVEDAVARNLLKVESLLAIVDRRGGSGVAGTTALRTALESGLVDDKIESKLELLLARIIAAAPIPAPVRQYELRCADGREVRLDNAWPDIKVTIEPDGRRWHGSATQARTTRARSRSITQTGWQHYVYGWAEITETPHEVGHEVEAIVLPRYLAA